MKTLITVLVLSAATISAQAQDTYKSDKKASQSVKRQTQQDYSAQAKDLTDRMTRDLNLSATQANKVMEQNKNYYSDLASMQTKNMDIADMQNMQKKSMDKYDASLKKILKDDQYKKYTSMKSDYMKAMNVNAMPHNSDMDNMEK